MDAKKRCKLALIPVEGSIITVSQARRSETGIGVVDADISQVKNNLNEGEHTPPPLL